jgi:hypothetical protein
MARQNVRASLIVYTRLGALGFHRSPSHWAVSLSSIKVQSRMYTSSPAVSLL